MPKLLCNSAAVDAAEARKVRTLTCSRHALAEWRVRATTVVRSWDGLRTTAIAAEPGYHPQTARERLVRFKAEGMDGLGDRPGAGRKRRLTEAERGHVLALASATRPTSSCRRVRSRWSRGKMSGTISGRSPRW